MAIFLVEAPARLSGGADEHREECEGWHSSIASTLIPFTTVFFLAVFWADGTTSSPRLVQATRLALAGAILSAGVHGVAFVVSGLSPVPPGDVNIIFFLAGAPIVLFAAGSWLYFLWVIRLSERGVVDAI